MKDKNSKQGHEPEEKKMTIYEYEQKFVKRQNSKGAAFLLKLIIAIIALGLFAALFSVAYKVYEINIYAGYVAAGVCLLLYIFFFIVPVVKILKTDYFKTNVNSKHASEAKRHNRRVRKNIAQKIIDFNSSVSGAGWYDDEVVCRLEKAYAGNDTEGIKKELTVLYGGSVKSSAKAIIAKNAVKSGIFSAVSQSGAIDAALISAVNLQMIKDIVFLYGFRPSDARLVKIFSSVLINSLVAYGLSGVKIGKGIAKTLGGAAKGIPLLGEAISVLVDSSVQGLANGALTAVIGFQTIKYLNHEYKLQDILDGVELQEEEEREIFKEVEEELKKANSKKKAARATQTV